MINTAPLTGDAARLARLADIVVANETEFELLAGASVPDAEARQATLKKLHAETGQTFVVTLGGDGVIAIRDGQILTAEGLKIEPVDTVGAGDTFAAIWPPASNRGSILRKRFAGPRLPVRSPASAAAPNHRSRLPTPSARGSNQASSGLYRAIVTIGHGTHPCGRRRNLPYRGRVGGPHGGRRHGRLLQGLDDEPNDAVCEPSASGLRRHGKDPRAPCQGE